MESILKEPKVTYLEKLRFIVGKAGLSDVVTITEIESISLNQGIKRFVKLEGKGSINKKELIDETKEITQEILSSEGMPIDDCWKITYGPVVGETLPDFTIKSIKDDKLDFKIQDKNQIIKVLFFWTCKSRSFESETEFVSLMLQANQFAQKLNLYMINIDNEKDACVQLIRTKGWDLVVEQFFAENLHLDSLGHNLDSLPLTVVLDSLNQIRYIGSAYSIDLSTSITEYIKSNQFEIIFRKTAKQEENLWWVLLDEESKLEIVNEINNSLCEVCLNSLQFSVITQSIWHKNEETIYATPVIIGKLDHESEDTLKSFISDLEETLNFKSTVFEITYLN